MAYEFMNAARGVEYMGTSELAKYHTFTIVM